MITEKQIQAVVQRIVEGYAPDRIILFGSYAYGEPHENSDLDLLVIKNDDEAPAQERRRQLMKLLRTDPWVIDVDLAPLNAVELREVSRNRCRREYIALRRGRVLFGLESRPARVPDEEPLSGAEKLSIRRLLKSVEQDLAAARNVGVSLNHYDMVARTNQSAAEKLLKARLLSLRAQPPSGHDLNRLLAAVARLENVEAATWRDAELLAPFAALFHDYSFTIAHPPTLMALVGAAASIYQTVVPRIQQSLT